MKLGFLEWSKGPATVQIVSYASHAKRFDLGKVQTNICEISLRKILDACGVLRKNIFISTGTRVQPVFNLKDFGENEFLLLCKNCANYITKRRVCD